MNPNLVPVTGSHGRQVWRWVLGGCAVLLAIVALGAVRLLTLPREATALRQELLAAWDGHCTTRFQLNLDGAALGTVRAGLRLADLPPEARLALAAVRQASVGVYALTGPAAVIPGQPMIPRVDAAMARRGYERLVAVRDGDETVLVYAPANATGDGLDVCLAVVDGEDLIVVSARVAMAPLLELIERSGSGRPAWLVAKI
jgi:hypothetical protein